VSEGSAQEAGNTDLGHSFTPELELDRLDVARSVDLNIVLALGELGFERGT
jgi:hypothetical protein